MSIHGSYGFGLIDGVAAVRLAEAWSALHSSPLTSANEQTGASLTTDLGAGIAIPDNGTEATFTISSAVNISVEYLQLNLNFNHAFIGDINIFLTDPIGHKIQIVYDSSTPTSFSGTWSYGVGSFLGVSSLGDWTVSVADAFALSDNGTMFSGSIDFFGAAITTDNVYHFTTDFLNFAAVDATRTIISDTNGGKDWLNFAAIPNPVELNLLPGASFSVNGLAWGHLSTGVEQFDNAITGDGGDIITGNSLANTLSGMRGNDTLSGGLGNDTLDGGAGSDTANFEGALNDVNVYLKFTGRQTGDGVDTLIGIENLTGSDFNDRLIGDAGDNIFVGGAGNDIIKGKGGTDQFFGGDGNDTMRGDVGDDILYGGAGVDILFGLNGLDQLFGGIDGDFLYGGRDADTINGDDGNDVVKGNLGFDVLFGGAGADDLRGGGGGDILLDGGTGNDFLFGEGGADTLNGGAGNDVLSGGFGGGIGDTQADVFIFADAASGSGGFDRIKDFENGLDIMDLTAFGFTDFTTEVATLATDVTGGLRINFGGGDVLFVENFLKADFDVTDVLLV
jgi:Ca2+-binding RTX toxin-like protein